MGTISFLPLIQSPVVKLVTQQPTVKLAHHLDSLSHVARLITVTFSQVIGHTVTSPGQAPGTVIATLGT